MTAPQLSLSLLLRRIAVFALAFGIWFAPGPAGLTAPAWHLFAVFVAAIASVLVGAFPLLTSTMLAVAAVVLTGTISPAQGVRRVSPIASVLLVVIAFLVAQAVVKSGSGPAHQPVHGEPVRPLVAGARLQHRAHGRGDRAGVSEQHRARRRALSGRAVGGAGRRFAARRSRGPPARRLPDVLRDGEPRRLVRPLDDGHVGQSDRHPGGARSSDWRSASASGSSRPRCRR